MMHADADAAYMSMSRRVMHCLRNIYTVNVVDSCTNQNNPELLKIFSYNCLLLCYLPVLFYPTLLS